MPLWASHLSPVGVCLVGPRRVSHGTEVEKESTVPSIPVTRSLNFKMGTDACRSTCTQPSPMNVDCAGAQCTCTHPSPMSHDCAGAQCTPLRRTASHSWVQTVEHLHTRILSDVACAHGLRQQVQRPVTYPCWHGLELNEGADKGLRQG